MTLLATIPPPPLTSLHVGPLRITLFGAVVAIALLVGAEVTRRRYAAAGGDQGAFAGAAAVGIPVAQALGRPADYVSQELFATPTTTFRLLGINRNGWIAVALRLGGTAGLVVSRRRRRSAAAPADQPIPVIVRAA